MTSMPMTLDVYHGRKPRCLQDTERFLPMLYVHQPPIAAWLQVDPLPEPLESSVSNEIGYTARSIGLYLLLLSPPHLLSSFVYVKVIPLAFLDPCLQLHMYLFNI
jgi:hypothetical protein